MKTLTAAVLEAEKHSKQAPKHEALSGIDTDGLKLAYEALNPYRVFNIRKLDLPKSYGSSTDYAPFFALLNKLHDRTLTGNAAKAAVTETLALYDADTAKILVRVLTKDLKCGATSSTFMKLYPELNIPSFDLMGAAKVDKKYKWEFPCIGEAKYDGQRLVAVVTALGVEYFSRSGRPSDYCAGLFEDELKLLHTIAFGGVDFVLDGEALANSFSETAQARGGDNAAAKANLKFRAFDYMTLEQWKAQDCPMEQEERSRRLEEMISSCGLTKVIKSKSKVLNNMQEAQDFYEEVLEEGLNDDGTPNGLGEGLIVKRRRGLYRWNMSGSRSDEWAKWKPVIDVDVEIIDFEEGAAGTKNEGKLGALVVRGQDENGNKIHSRCGGFKVADDRMKPLLDELATKASIQLTSEKAPNFIKNKDQFLRQYIWDNKDEFRGRLALIEGQELSLAEDSDVYAIRFPQFVMLRDDK